MKDDVRAKDLLTVAEQGHLLDGSGVLEEVQVDEGDVLTANVLHDRLDAGVAHLAEGDIQRGGVSAHRDGEGAGEEGQEGSS